MSKQKYNLCDEAPLDCHFEQKSFRCKLTAPSSLQTLMNGVSSYINDEKHDLHIWHLKHKELIWLFTHYFTPEELRSFFHPMTDEQVPFKSLVLTHYRKANSTEELADLCGYSVHTFRHTFKEEFGVAVPQWLIQKRAEHIKHQLSLPYIPLVDIMDAFNFSSIFPRRNTSIAFARNILVTHPEISVRICNRNYENRTHKKQCQ